MKKLSTYLKQSAGLRQMETGELLKERPKAKKVKYKDFTISVYQSPKSNLYWAINDIGEDYMEVPLFRTEREAINWDKKNIDQYVKENK